MSKGLQYIMRLASEGGKQVTATLMSIGEGGEKAFQKLDHAVSLNNVTMDKLGTTIKRLGLALSAQAAALAYLTARQMSVIDANAKMADSFSISYKSMTDIMLLAEESGVGFEKLGAGMTALQVKIADGSKASAEAFAQIGLKVEDLLKMPIDQQFSTVAEALSKVENATLRIGYASDIFGKKVGRELLNVFDDYAAKLQDVTAFNEKFGISLSRIDAAKVEQANDAFGRVKSALMGMVNTIAVQVAPAIEGVSKYLVGLGYDKDIFAKGVYDTMDVLAKMAEIVRHAYHGVGLAIGSVKVVAADATLFVMEHLQKLGVATADVLNLIPGVNRKASITDMDIMKARAASERARVDMARKIQENNDAFAPGNTILDALNRARESSQKTAGSTAARRDAINILAGGSGENLIQNMDAADKKGKELKKTTDAISESARKADAVYNDFIDGIIDGFSDGKLSAQEFGQVALRAVQQVLRASDNQGNSIGGDIFNSIFSSVGSFFSGFMPSFATGIDRVPYDMTANIHRDEAVLNAQEAKEWRSGGGSKMNVVINNNTSSKVSVAEKQSASGGRELYVQIDEMMAKVASDPGSRFSRAAVKAGGLAQR